MVAIGAFFGFFEAVRLALDRNDFRAMDESVNERYDASCAWEDLLPLSERLVRGNDGALLFVAPVEQLEEQVCVTIGVREVPDLIDDEDVRRAILP